MTNKDVHKLGEFLVENKIITKEQLLEALTLQKDNPERLIGHILVTLGAVTKEQLIMAFEMYLVTTGLSATHADEWLDQDEIDAIMQKLKKD
jgi:hypothetical protein